MDEQNQHNIELEIVNGCIRNDRRSQEALYRRYFATMLRMCQRYTKDHETALEIVNNGFLRVFKKLDTFTFSGSLEGWMRRIMFHSISDYFRNQPKMVHFMVFEEKDMEVETRALDNMYFEDILKLVDKLPPATQEVFRLYAIDGLSHNEISESVGISVGTSKWHLSAAREKLKQLITKQHQYIISGHHVK